MFILGAAELAVVAAVVDPHPAMRDASIAALSTLANTFFFIFITSCEKTGLIGSSSLCCMFFTSS